jgi:hypothetical protein
VPVTVQLLVLPLIVAEPLPPEASPIFPAALETLPPEEMIRLPLPA